MEVNKSDIRANTYYRRILTQRFNEVELRTLCFDLGIDYEDLPSVGKAGKARELVGFLHRHERIAELLKVGKKIRPEISWDIEDEEPQKTLPFQGLFPNVLHSRLSDRLTALKLRYSRLIQVSGACAFVAGFTSQP